MTPIYKFDGKESVLTLKTGITPVEAGDDIKAISLQLRIESIYIRSKGLLSFKRSRYL